MTTRIAYFPQGQQAEQALADVMREILKGSISLPWKGNAPLNEDGMFCILAGEPFTEVKTLCQRGC